MAKKVLILSASPRKGGNSDMLCDQFRKGAEEAGHTVEKISLYDKSIGFCRACYACFREQGIHFVLNTFSTESVNPHRAAALGAESR